MPLGTWREPRAESTGSTTEWVGVWAMMKWSLSAIGPGRPVEPQAQVDHREYTAMEVHDAGDIRGHLGQRLDLHGKHYPLDFPEVERVYLTIHGEEHPCLGCAFGCYFCRPCLGSVYDTCGSPLLHRLYLTPCVIVRPGPWLLSGGRDQVEYRRNNYSTLGTQVFLSYPERVLAPSSAMG